MWAYCTTTVTQNKRIVFFRFLLFFKPCLDIYNCFHLLLFSYWLIELGFRTTDFAPWRQLFLNKRLPWGGGKDGANWKYGRTGKVGRHWKFLHKSSVFTEIETDTLKRLFPFHFLDYYDNHHFERRPLSPWQPPTMTPHQDDHSSR